MAGNQSKDNRNTGAASAGITGLPTNWQIAMQLISTFGLAVFLVLYYLFVIRPEDVARYEAMRQTVDELKQVIKADAAVVSDEQAERLERLYIDAVTPKVAELLRHDMPKQEQIDEIDRQLMLKADELRGFIRESGRTLTEQLRTRLRPSHPDDPNVAKILVNSAAENNIDAEGHSSFTRTVLRDVLHGRRMGK